MHLIYDGFEWDLGKAQTNKEKHGVSFEEAATVFDDLHARVIQDPDHSYEEERFIILGLSIKMNVMVVCHCVREITGKIRIISARKATKKEESSYWRLRNEN